MKEKTVILIIIVIIGIVVSNLLFFTPARKYINNDIKQYNDSINYYINLVKIKDKAIDSLENNYILLSSEYDSLIKQKHYLEQNYGDKKQNIIDAPISDDELWFNSTFTGTR